jgi:hypothetical protein
MRAISITITIALFLLSGCGIKEVKPWEKGTLAKESMKPNGGNVLVGKFVNHIYFSKEATKGGGGVAGGGCGCN